MEPTNTNPSPTIPAPGAPPATAVVPAPAAPAKSQLATLKEKADAIKNQILPDSDAPAPVDPAVPAATEPPAFTPNLKFKAYDKEFEVADDFFKGLVKDEASQKKIIDIHERAHGFDGLKEMHKALREENKTTQEKYNSIDSNLKRLSSYVAEGDLGSFFETLKIPEAMVMEYVAERLKLLNAPAEQRVQMEEQEKIRRHNRELREQNETLSTGVQTAAVQAKQQEIEMALGNPEVAGIAKIIDEKLGAGSFKQAVLDRGILAFNMSRQVISAQQAVQEALKLFAPFVSLLAQPGQQQSPAAVITPPATKTPAAPKPAIPNFNGGSASPLKQGVRSIADIKKRADQLGSATGT